MKHLLVTCLLLGSACSMPPAQTAIPPENALEDAVSQTMEQTGAQGLAVAVVRDGAVSSVNSYGIRNAAGDPLTEQTVMYGASLTKTAFAYLVLQLVDEGKLDLDQSIAEILPKPLPEYRGQQYLRSHAPFQTLAGDERWRDLTPRILLAHGSGFRNLFFFKVGEGFVGAKYGLEFNFDPGSRYGYSGDGFTVLQFVLEEGLGLDLRAEFNARIFEPFGMTRTDVMWRDDFATDLADGFQRDGSSVAHDERSKVRAAGSMDTTIADMAKFAAALVRCERLSEESCAQMFAPTIRILTASQFPTLQEELPENEALPGLSSGLGLIVQERAEGKVLFKGGHNEITGNMLVCLPERGDCVVILANDVRAEAGFPAIARAALGETGVPWGWEYAGLDLIE